MHRFQNNCVEGLNCGLYLFTYLFVASCDRGGLRRPPSITSNAFMIGNKKITQKNVPGACGNVLTISNMEA